MKHIIPIVALAAIIIGPVEANFGRYFMRMRNQIILNRRKCLAATLGIFSGGTVVKSTAYRLEDGTHQFPTQVIFTCTEGSYLTKYMNLKEAPENVVHEIVYEGAQDTTIFERDAIYECTVYDKIILKFNPNIRSTPSNTTLKIEYWMGKPNIQLSNDEYKNFLHINSPKSIQVEIHKPSWWSNLLTGIIHGKPKRILTVHNRREGHPHYAHSHPHLEPS